MLSLSSYFTSDLDCKGRLCFFFFVALNIYGLIGFGFVSRVRSPSAGRLSVTKL